MILRFVMLHYIIYLIIPMSDSIYQVSTDVLIEPPFITSTIIIIMLSRAHLEVCKSHYGISQLHYRRRLLSWLRSIYNQKIININLVFFEIFHSLLETKFILENIE